MNNSITKNMDMERVTKVLAAAIELVHRNQSLDNIDLAQWGIDCPPEEKTLLGALLEILLKDQQVLATRLDQINRFQNNVQQTVGTITDEKVKVTKDAATSQYLADVLTATVGRLKTTADKIHITGLTPIGARMCVNPNRKGDFDASGKGKAGTDLEGWAIRNGNNGLDNALGRMVMYTDTLDNAGKKAGSNAITVALKNIASFTLAVSGEIKESLLSPIKARIPYGTVSKCFGISSCRDIIIPGAGKYFESDALDLKHTHAHTLSVAHTNNQVESIPIIPEHIKEIPIEFIGV